MTPLLPLLAAVSVGLAPVPAEPPPDPLGWGYLGVYDSQEAGIKLREVTPGAPAAKAGLQPGDEIVRVGSLRPKSFTEMAGYVSGLRPGTRLDVEVLRDGEKKVVTVRLGARPADAGPPPQYRRDVLPIPER